MRESRDERRRQHTLPFPAEEEPPPTIREAESGASPEREQEAAASLDGATVPSPEAEEPNPYEAKLEERKQRLEAAAERAGERADASFGASRRAVDGIPFGQPILRGHHSERRHRRDLEKSHRAMDRAVAEAKRAEELRRKAKSVGKGGISSDDPAAVEKLQAKLEDLEAHRERMKLVNRQFRKGGWPTVTAVSEKVRARLERDMDLMGAIAEVPFPPYALKNVGSNIRSVKERIGKLKEAAEEDVRPTQIGPGYFLEDARRDNRVRFQFEAKPDAETRALLKGNGFRWAPTVGAWQRKASPAAWRAAEAVHTELCAASPVEVDVPTVRPNKHESVERESTAAWVARHVRDDVIRRIRNALNSRSDRTWSVTGGRGTSHGWLTIDAPPRRRTFGHCETGDIGPDGRPTYELKDTGESGGVMGPEDQQELARLLGYDDVTDVHHQGVKVPSAHDYYAEFIDRAEGRAPAAFGKPYWD